MKTTRRAIFALLLALAPVRALSASILWVTVDPDAQVLNPDGTLLEEHLRNFRSVNAAKVSVSDASGTTSYLIFAYEAGNPPQMVVDDQDSDVAQLDLSGSGSSGGSGSGGNGESAGGYVAVSLRDLLQTADRESTTITLELGHVDWSAYDTYVGNNPDGSWAVGDRFQGLATASASLGELVRDQHVSEQNNLFEPTSTPWKPDTFTAVPEPSVCLTALLGVLLLSKRRRPVHAR